MKRLCKDVDITDRSLISKAVYTCLNKKYKRNDVVKYFSELSGLAENQIRCIYYRYGKSAMYPFTELAITQLQTELIENRVTFPKIWYRKKVDGSSGKVRMIGIQNIKQQLYDYIAVEGLSPIWKRIGEYQYASVKGRGTTKGKEVISHWIRNKKMKYFCKLDAKKCFESIDHEKIMEFLRKRAKNDKLLYLVKTLLNSFEKGLSIGSYLSQYLCNLYMSILYHEIKENMYKTRRGKRNNIVKKCMIYMDDILLIGTSITGLRSAIKRIIEKAHEMLLTITVKEGIKNIDDYAIDMLGFKVYRTHTEIRSRVFIRVRRTFKNAKKNLTAVIAKKCISYNGYLNHTDSKRFQKKWKVSETLQKCKELMKK